jgi:hypothetical protein
MSDNQKICATIQIKAREIYESRREIVGNRPKWEQLDPADESHMGLRDAAFTLAKIDLGVP